MHDIDSRLGEAQKKISRLPATEQQFINIQRQYEISGSQYQLLLEKRAEAGILQASNLPDTKVINIPRLTAANCLEAQIGLAELHHWPC